MKNTNSGTHRYLSIPVDIFDSYRDIDRHRQISTALSSALVPDSAPPLFRRAAPFLSGPRALAFRVGAATPEGGAGAGLAPRHAVTANWAGGCVLLLTPHFLALAAELLAEAAFLHKTLVLPFHLMLQHVDGPADENDQGPSDN